MQNREERVLMCREEYSEEVVYAGEAEAYVLMRERPRALMK